MITTLEDAEKASCFLDKRVVSDTIEQKFTGAMMSKNNDVYRFIVRYKTAHAGSDPSFEQIMEGCQISSKSVVAGIMVSLQDAGLLVQDGIKNIYIPKSRWILEEA